MDYKRDYIYFNIKNKKQMILCSECKIEFNSNRSLSNHLRGGCKTNRKYEKICDCGKILTYRSPKEFQMAIDNDSKCIKCCNKITKHCDDTKLKISNRLKSLYENGEITPNMSGVKLRKTKRNLLH